MIKLNDPRITAYLLGELDPAEVEIIEQALRSSPTLAKNVEQMRQTIELLKLALPEESLNCSSQKTEQPLEGVSKDDSKKSVLKTDNKWLTFIWQAVIALVIGLGIYVFCHPGIDQVLTPGDSSSNLSSQTNERDNDRDLQVSFAPTDVSNLQPSIDKTWEEYGLTSQQVEQLGQCSDQPNAQETDIIALFPQEAVNKTERIKAYFDLHDPDGWQAKIYKPQQNNSGSAIGVRAVFSDKLIIENPVEFVTDAPKSSFGLVPETASWKILQQSLKDSGSLPSSQTVRAGQYVNHFRYSFNRSQTTNSAFSVSALIGVHPWTPGLLLAVIDVRSQSGSEGNVVAKDASIEITFSPEQVKAYRLIGCEKRLTDEDSTPYTPVESAQIAANTEVVALYELALTDDSVLSNPEVKPNSALFVASIKYRKPDANAERPDANAELQTETHNVDLPSAELLKDNGANPDFQFAAAVALFAQILQKSEYSGNGSLDAVLQLAQNAEGDDPQRKEFVEQVRQIKGTPLNRSNVPKPEAAQSKTE
ncbi:MAG: von Willebrand factor type A domain-containing protein [Thermoguttaceae bacterium]|nr:von Willebrand factor type A domain-containing protein [Thermoguttaceae bacterium]